MNDKNNEKILSDKEKLAAILQYLRIKIAEFATKTGSNADHLYNLNSGKINEFSQEVRRNILNTYKEINPQWLLTGEGNMLRSDNSSQQSSVGDNSGIIVQHGVLKPTVQQAVGFFSPQKVPENATSLPISERAIIPE